MLWLETRLESIEELPQAADTLRRHRGGGRLVGLAIVDQIRLADPNSAWIAVRKLHDKPDLAVPAVCLLGSHHLPD
jgi:hypothetical protein